MTSHFYIQIPGFKSQLAAISAPIIPIGSSGIIIGHLFCRNDMQRRVTQLSPSECEEIVASAGKSLATDYWGGYVAVLEFGGSVTVFRDPSGIMPCYWREDAGRFSFSNDIGTVASLACPPAVDIEAILQFLGRPGYMGERTGLTGIYELSAGHALIVTGEDAILESWWSPWDHVSQAQMISFEEAASQVEQTVRDCVTAWASCFDNITIGVSGGLDSSIVAAHASSVSNVQCLTIYGDDPEGDERHYARILTGALHLPLHEKPYSLDHIDVRKPVLPYRPWPNIAHFAQSIFAIHGELDRAEPDAYFSGNGGDNIFCSLRSASPFLDRLLIDGPGFGLTATLRDLCVLTETDAPKVLKTAWQQYLQMRKPGADRRNLEGLAAPQRQADVPDHPWLTSPKGALPGKIGHVRQLVRAQQSHELYPRKSHAPAIAPLLSQPIMELCLSIPTWLWINEGKNRAVARRAFERILPAALLARSSKGGPGGFGQSIYQASESAIKEELSSGFLARRGHLDLAYINATDDPSWRGRDRAQRLLFLLGGDTWCKWWTEQHMP